MKPVRIQRKRTKGFNLQAESIARNGLPCVYVGRPTDFGNPFRVGDFVTFPKTGNVLFWKTNEQNATPDFAELKTVEDVLEAYQTYLNRCDGISKYEKLRGKNLACFCKEGEPCHADILLKYANEREIAK